MVGLSLAFLPLTRWTIGLENQAEDLKGNSDTVFSSRDSAELLLGLSTFGVGRGGVRPILC